MPDHPFVSVTNAEVWAELRRHGDLLLQIQEHLEQLEKTADDRETRIRKLELRYYALLAGLVTGTLGVVVTLTRGFG